VVSGAPADGTAAAEGIAALERGAAVDGRGQDDWRWCEAVAITS